VVSVVEPDDEADVLGSVALGEGAHHRPQVAPVLVPGRRRTGWEPGKVVAQGEKTRYAARER
jgi:hypothetical protein